MKQGIIAAVCAFSIWGIMPLYWKLIQEVPAPEIMTHRIIWSMLFVAALLVFRRQFMGALKYYKNRKQLAASLCCSLLIALNWLTYIWSVNNGYIIESSLGYFINPIINIILGVLLLKERLRSMQWLSVALASTGVGYLTYSYGSPPWIALTLACSFGLYGLLRKKSPIPSLEGLAMETSLLLIPALLYTFWLSWNSTASFGQHSISSDLLLIGGGIITAIPLLFFSYAAQRIPLSTLGIIQYIGPTLQLLIGIWVYNESFEGPRAIAFTIIWSALAIYSLEGSYRAAKNHKTKSQTN